MNANNEVETAKKSDIKVAAGKKHACTYAGCNFAFNRPWRLHRHLYTHTNERPFKCDVPGCSKAYTDNSRLQRHKLVTHTGKKEPPKNYPCPIEDCSKVFTQSSSVARHIKNHNSIKRYNCTKCSESFKNFWQFKHHFLAHWGLDPYICKKCNKSFTTKTELRKHETEHKVYLCEEKGCTETFNSWNAVRKHLKESHPRKYQCDFCKKFYKNKWTLTDHVLSHLPLNTRNVILCPFKDCERYYLYDRNLEAHIKSYHQNITFKCKFDGCDKTFTSKKRLMDHEKRHLEPPPIRKLDRNKPRKPRKDKGLPKRSMASLLSGIYVPPTIDKDLAQNNLTPEVKEFVENLKEKFNEVVSIENSESGVS